VKESDSITSGTYSPSAILRRALLGEVIATFLVVTLVWVAVNFVERAERATFLSRAQQSLQAALNSLGSWLRIEAARPPGDYFYLRVAPEVFPRLRSASRSVLAELDTIAPIPGTLAYFQIGPRDEIESPLLPDFDQIVLTENSVLPLVERVSERSEQVALLRESIGSNEKKKIRAGCSLTPRLQHIVVLNERLLTICRLSEIENEEYLQGILIDLPSLNRALTHQSGASLLGHIHLDLGTKQKSHDVALGLPAPFLGQVRLGGSASSAASTQIAVWGLGALLWVVISAAIIMQTQSALRGFELAAERSLLAASLGHECGEGLGMLVAEIFAKHTGATLRTVRHAQGVEFQLRFGEELQ
jgi:hypothetical protein